MRFNIRIVLAAGLIFAVHGILHAAPDVAEYPGTCDASAAVALGPNLFILGDDENQILRVYRRDKPMLPVATCDVNSFLKVNPKKPEVDIEAAARIGDRVYWIGSHSTDKKGKQQPGRHRLFATDAKLEGEKIVITPVGQPYMNLIEDFAAAETLKDLKLGEAAKLPSKGEGGLNIEGLAATPSGGLLIGFRNPVPGGRALIVPLDNPAEVIEGKHAKLGKPIVLDLEGLGIRSIDYFEARKEYLIIAGPFDSGSKKNSHLYEWTGSAKDAPGR